MNILQHRKALSSAGLAIGFGLLVAWMVPPTDPRPMASNWREQFKPVAPPAPVDFAGFAPAMAAMQAYPVAQYASARDGFGSADEVAVHRGRSDEGEVQRGWSNEAGTPPAIERPVQRDDEEPPFARADMPRHGGGYRWVDRRAAMDRDICDAAPNPVVADRCRSYFEGRRAEFAASDQPDDAGEEDRGDY
jgi:hypothetical protein